jgi:hypothetical protein
MSAERRPDPSSVCGKSSSPIWRFRHRLPVISTDNEDSAKAGVLMYYSVTDVSVANQHAVATTPAQRLGG